MSTPIRVLILEDRREDARLMLRELRRSGYEPDAHLVDNEVEFVAHLSPDIDVILSDYHLPQFDAPRALERLQDSGLDIPLIVVTGSISEEIAVTCIQHGAFDYLLKDRMSRLGAAVVNALEARQRRAEQRQAAQALRDSERHFRLLADHSTDMISVHRLDGVYTYVSPASRTLIGYIPEELIGKSCYDFFHPDDIAAVRSAHECLLSDCDKFSITCRLRARDGHYVWVESLAHKTRDEKTGQALELQISSRDVTARKQAEQALRDSEERFKNAFEYSSIGMALVTPAGRYVQVNHALCEIVGYSEEELLDTDFQSITHPEDLAMAQTSFEQLVDGQAPSVRQEKRYRHKEGHEVWVRINVSSVRGDDGKPVHLILQVENVTERKMHETRVHRQLARIMALRTIDMTISASLDLRLTLRVVLEQVIEQLNVDAACVLLYHASNQTLEHAAWRGFGNASLDGTEVRLGEGFAGRAALERLSVHVENLSDVTDVMALAPHYQREGFVTYHGVPLLAKGQVQGVLEVFNRAPLETDSDWLDFLETLAGQAAIAIDNAGMFDNLQKSNINLSMAYDTTIDGWSRALDMRDKETEGHSARVTEMTIRLSRAMGMREQDTMHIRRGALLHDIGKMGIPDSILLKPGALTDEEWVIMKRHPISAVELLSPIEYLRPALDIPYCHHEKWDGSGYPRGLKGEQIPLAARIFAVVDVWDALRSDRPYRPAWTIERVRKHIRDGSGSHFDPHVVEVFEKMVDEGATVWPQITARPT